MSQEKVEKKQNLKKNRKKIVKKQKRQHVMEIVAGVIVCVGIVAWLGYSAFNKYETYEKAHVASTAIDISSLVNYESGLTKYDYDGDK